MNRCVVNCYRTLCWLVTVGLIANGVVAQTKTSSDETPAVQESKSSQATTRAEPMDGDWPLFRGNTQSTGVAKSDLPDKLEVLWKFEVPKGAFEGTAAIVRDTSDPNLQTVYVGDLDGMLFALDLKTGQKKWEFKSESEIGFLTAPAVKDGRIFIGDIDGKFYCVDEAGQKVWSFQTDGEINSSANFYKSNVLFGSQDFHLYALNQETGELDWKYESQDQIRCSATVAGNRAFVAGCDGFFHVVDLDQGTEIGNTDIRSPTGATPAAVGNLVYFGTEQGDFFAVDWKEIQNEWIHEDEQGGNSIRSCAAVNDQHVVFGARNRQVVSLHPRTGNTNWNVTLKAKVDSSPVIVGDCVFVASTDGRLYALSLQDGSVAWEKQFNGGFLSSPAVAFGRLVIATDRGVVYCLGSK